MENKILVTRSSMPSFEEYTEMIRPLWESRWLTNMGNYHRQFEAKLCDYLKVQNVSLMVNGHMALEMAIQAMGFPKGGEVITTPFTFISTTHAIIRNDLQPVFCDVKMNDFTIDEKQIENLITEKTVAIVPVHVYGNICAVEKIQEIAYKYGLKVIYDAAHAFGEEYNGTGIGDYGDASIFSFHATKVFHTIEGGAVCYQEKAIGEKLYNQKNFGIRGEELVVSVGANAKMNEFSAAMGLCNLKNVESEIMSRKRIAELYKRQLENIPGIILNDMWSNKSLKRNYAYFAICCEENEYGISRDELYNNLKKHQVYTRKYFYPLTSDQVCFKNKWKDIHVPVARNIAEKILVLPMYGDLDDDDIKMICDLIKKYHKK